MASGKRSASNQLTHDNLHDEDTPEEAGFFKQADESELKGRVIKKAKRRGIASAEDNDDKPALFTGFKGFGIPTPQNASFSFNKRDGETRSSAIKFPSFGNSNGDAKPTAQISKNFTESAVDDVTEINNSKFLADLKVLSSSMLKWLTSYTDTNPYCYFTPVFADYAKHLANLKEKYKFDDGSSSPSPENPTEVRDPEDIPSSNKSSAADSEAAKPVVTPPKASANKQPDILHEVHAIADDNRRLESFIPPPPQPPAIPEESIDSNSDIATVQVHTEVEPQTSESTDAEDEHDGTSAETIETEPVVEPSTSQLSKMSSREMITTAEQMKSQLTCKICLSDVVGIAHLPCGHLISCVTCSARLDICPLCREQVRGTVRVHMPPMDN